MANMVNNLKHEINDAVVLANGEDGVIVDIVNNGEYRVKTNNGIVTVKEEDIKDQLAESDSEINILNGGYEKINPDDLDSDKDMIKYLIPGKSIVVRTFDLGAMRVDEFKGFIGKDILGDKLDKYPYYARFVHGNITISDLFRLLTRFPNSYTLYVHSEEYKKIAKAKSPQDDGDWNEPLEEATDLNNSKMRDVLRAMEKLKNEYVDGEIDPIYEDEECGFYAQRTGDVLYMLSLIPEYKQKSEEMSKFFARTIETVLQSDYDEDALEDAEFQEAYSSLEDIMENCAEQEIVYHYLTPEGREKFLKAMNKMWNDFFASNKNVLAYDNPKDVDSPEDSGEWDEPLEEGKLMQYAKKFFSKMKKDKPLTEGLQVGEMEYLISTYVSVDEYTSKVDQDDITIALFCGEKQVCDDLRDFLEKMYYLEIRDIEVSDSLTEDNKYIIFLELQRNELFPKILVDILDSIDFLINKEIKDWKFVTLNMKKKEPVTIENIRKYVRLSSIDEDLKIEKSEESSEEKKEEPKKEEKEVKKESVEYSKGNITRKYIDEGYVTEEEMNKIIDESETLDENALDIEVLEYNIPEAQVFSTDNNLFVVTGNKIKKLTGV